MASPRELTRNIKAQMRKPAEISLLAGKMDERRREANKMLRLTEPKEEKLKQAYNL